MPQTHYRTCHLCEANCGLVVEAEGRRVLRIAGDRDNPLSRGHICPKATAIADLQDDPDRLRRPIKRIGSDWVEIGFEQAFAEIGERVAAIIAAGGAATMYLGNPNAHNYSVITQTPLLKRALGTKAIYSASTIDQIPHQLVNMWMYGHNSLFPVADIDRTMFMLILGGNPLASNGSIWTVPDVKCRIADLQARGGRLVVVDPRRTETAQVADEHHFIRPGMDAAFLVALLLALDEAGRVEPGRLAPMLNGFDAAMAALRRFEIGPLAQACCIEAAMIRRLADEIGSGLPAIVYGRMGVSTQPFGSLCQWLIHLINIATGNFDREGGFLFGQPAVDVVATTGPGSFGRYRSRVSGLHEVMSEFPVVTLAEEILTPGDGQIRALVTVAGNPVLSTPDGAGLDAALASLDCMVSIDMYVNETTRHAHYILPPCGPLEKDHYPLLLASMAVRQFANYSPATFDQEEGTKSDWEIVAELARAIAAARGQAVPNIVHPRDALDQMLRASPRELTLTEVEAHPHGLDLGPLTPSCPDRLRTSDKRINCAPPMLIADLDRLAGTLLAPPADSLRLIGRRHVRNNNSWLHNSRRLIKGPERCTLMIHPDDASARGLADGALAEVRSRVGSVRVVVELTENVMPGVVSLPHGFGHGRQGVHLAVARERPGVSINDLTDPLLIDPISGNAALNGVPVEVMAVQEAVAAE